MTSMMLGDCFWTVTPTLRTSCGQLRRGDGDPVLDQHLRRVEVRAELEGDRQRHRAVAGTLAVHVEHVLDAVDLLLDGRGDGVGERLRIGPRIDGGDDDRRRRDLGVRRHGQREIGQTAQDDQDDGQHDGKDRPADEEVGKFHGDGRAGNGFPGLAHLPPWPPLTMGFCSS